MVVRRERSQSAKDIDRVGVISVDNETTSAFCYGATVGIKEGGVNA